MPYEIKWYIENEIIYIQFWDQVTIDELRASLLEVHRLLESSSRPLVHIFQDVGDVTQAISPRDTVGIVREIGNHERLGWSLILREKSILVKIGVAFGMSIFKIRTRTFETLEEAKAFLKTVDLTLSWDKVLEIN